ncbi:MAG: imidazoleglycerol-phosphate dehydratase HisB [Thermomicrobiales bacterium]|nr:imidazoleglycerol-phosphate dehydratase HisB [Thermomicrobiales bacterium]MCO5225732.1 imidazoleglycerol-phosphate dehydratase HisB [Thermomicrobiales bacterium]MCO5228031.1 imidazoleglycerol-phosphate dehydratase HisB [Thermomicrobiales bacterium]
MSNRYASISRTTDETDITLTLNIDGTGVVAATTGVPFLDHMLDALCRHARWDLTVTATGDAAMDPHHTVEDVGIAFGQALKQALGERRGIDRYGYAYAPLDEALARVVVDISGRPFLEFEAVMPEPVIGADFAASLVEEFWRSVAMNAGITMHIDLLRARNSHHAAEAIFKAAAVAFRMAVRIGGNATTVPSTKGVLE